MLPGSTPRTRANRSPTATLSFQESGTGSYLCRREPLKKEQENSSMDTRNGRISSMGFHRRAQFNNHCNQWNKSLEIFTAPGWYSKSSMLTPLLFERKKKMSWFCIPSMNFFIFSIIRTREHPFFVTYLYINAKKCRRFGRFPQRSRHLSGRIAQKNMHL